VLDIYGFEHFKKVLQSFIIVARLFMMCRRIRSSSLVSTMPTRSFNKRLVDFDLRPVEVQTDFGI
jgi:hypothetical protein